jgi:hypothetical protein
MYYIFNAGGTCISSCNYSPDTVDLTSRGEVAVASDTDYNIATITLVNDIITVKEPIEPTDAEKLATAQDSKIAALQGLLKRTDYEAIKYAEGIITATQFANLKAAREAWRTAINTIQTCTTVAAVQAVAYSTDIPAVE